MCIENRFAGWRLCVCSQVNSKACLGVTVRYMRVPRVKMGLFDKWQSGEKKATKKTATQIHSRCLISGDLSYR